MKGHATDDMVKQNIVNKCDKVGNDKADGIAAEGVKLFGAEAIQTGSIFLKRHMAYAKMVENIHTDFIEAIIKKNELIEAKRKKLNPFPSKEPNQQNGNNKFVQAKEPSKDNAEHPQKLGSMLDVNMFANITKKYPRATQVQKFLQNISFQKVRPEEEGTTWLELYILYKMQGGECVISDPGNKAASRPSMRLQLKTFKAIVKNISTNLMNPQDAETFRPSLSPKPRLWCLGIQTHLAMFRASMCLEDEARTNLAEHILSSQARRGPKKAKEALRTGNRIKVIKFASVNRTSWSRSIRKHQKRIFRATQENLNEAQSSQAKAEEQVGSGYDPAKRSRKEEQGDALEPQANQVFEQVQSNKVQPTQKAADQEVVTFKCPHCELRAKASRPAFNLVNLGAKTWCKACKKSWQVKSWLCPCEKLWFQCDSHKASAGKRCEEEESGCQKAQPNRSLRKRRAPPQRLDDLEGLSNQEVGKKCVKRGRSSTPFLVVRKGMLSANLKRKFGHLIEN